MHGHPFPLAGKTIDAYLSLLLAGLRIEQQAAIAVDHIKGIRRSDKGAAVYQIILGQLALPEQRAVVAVAGDDRSLMNARGNR